MTGVEEIKALVDMLTPEERGSVCVYWHPDWTEERDNNAPRVEETAPTSRVAEIKKMIESLSPMEQCELNSLVQDWPDDDWDKQIKADAAAGKLDWMIKEAECAEREDTAREYPEPAE